MVAWVSHSGHLWGAACCKYALSVEASPSCRQNSPTRIFRVRVRAEIMLSWVMRHTVTMKVTERTVQPRANKNSCNATGTMPMGIGRLSFVRPARLWRSSAAFCSAGGLPEAMELGGGSLCSRALGCQPAIFHGKEKSKMLHEICACQIKADLELLGENQTALSSWTSPTPPHPPKMYASSRIWMALMSVSGLVS